MTAIPQTLTWAGRNSALREHAFPLGMAATTGAAAGGGAYAYEESDSADSKLPVHPAAIGVAAALVVGGSISGWRALTNKMPKLPQAHEVPKLGKIGKVEAPQHAKVGATVGDAHGTYTYMDTITVTDPDGTTRTISRPVTQSFEFPVSLDEAVGETKGYKTLDEAIEQMAQENVSTVYRKEGDNVFAYFNRDGGRYSRDDNRRWGDLDSITVGDPATVAVVSPHGALWRGTGDDLRGKFVHAKNVSVEEGVPGISDEKIASYALRNHSDPDIRAGDRITSKRGLGSLEEALAQAKAREGDDGVVKRQGRFHVVSTHGDQPDRNFSLMGLKTTGASGKMSALEVDGEVYVPTANYWMTPRT